MSIIHEIKDKTDLAAYIESCGVTLRKGHGSRMGMCPFHANTNTPALAVFPQTQSWYCFGCGVGGDVITFCEKYHNLTTAEAVRELAEQAGLTIDNSPEGKAKRAKVMKERACWQAAADYYRRVLDAAGENNYFYQRGLWSAALRPYLGLADGGLTKYLRSMDLVQEGLALGLLRDNGNGLKDVFGPGYAIYIHLNRHGDVIDMHARATNSTLQPPHRNLSSEKLPFLAVADQKSNDWILVEGAACALTWCSWGYNGCATGGTNLSNVVEFLPPSATLYFVADNDGPGQFFKLKVIPILPPNTRFITLPELVYTKNGEGQTVAITIKDSNDLARLPSARASTPPPIFLPTQESYQVLLDLVPDKDEPRYDELIAALIKQYDRYESVAKVRIKREICDKLKLSISEFNALLKAALKGEEDDTAKKIDDPMDVTKLYRHMNGRTFYFKQNEYGQGRWELIIEAVIKIEEIIVRKGVSNDKLLVISCQVPDKDGGVKKLSNAIIPLEKFESMSWITQNWEFVSVRPPQAQNKQYVMESIQKMSTPTYQLQLEELGWGEHGFATHEGIIGYPEGKATVDLSINRLEHKLSNYRIPLVPKNVEEAWAASFNMWQFGNEGVLLWAAAHLAPLGHVLRPGFGILLYGQTNSFKSTILGHFLCFYGDWWKYGNEINKYLPISFTSTSNSIMKELYMCKDVLTSLDDMFPRPGAEKPMEQTLLNVIRGIGDGASRGRLDKGGKAFQALSDYPRGTVIITAEQMPDCLNQSDQARLIALRLMEFLNDKDPALQARKDLLNRSLSEWCPFLSNAMSSYIKHILERKDGLKKYLHERVEKWTEKFSKSQWQRQPQAFARLMTALEFALDYAKEQHYLSNSEYQLKLEYAFSVLDTIMLENNKSIVVLDPIEMFLQQLRELLQTQWWLAEGMIATEEDRYKTDLPLESDPVPPPGKIKWTFVGYETKKYIYIKVYYIGELFRLPGHKFPIGRNDFYKRIQAKGFAMKGKWRVRHSNTPYELLRIDKERVFVPKDVLFEDNN